MSITSASHTAMPSNRKFGALFSAILLFAAGYFFYRSHGAWAIVALTAGVSMALATWIQPDLLTRLNAAWFRLGLLMGKVVSPIVLGLIFFVVITPVALVTRTMGRDELKMKKRSVASYWQERAPGEPAPESFKNQF